MCMLFSLKRSNTRINTRVCGLKEEEQQQIFYSFFKHVLLIITNLLWLLCV